MTDKDPWPRVSKADPCPVCGKADACKVSPDGAVCLCKRVEAGAFKTAAGGWFFHRLNGDTRPASNSNGQAHAPRGWPTLAAAIDAAAKGIGGVVGGDWTYHSADGSEHAKAMRFDLPDGGKAFRPFHLAKGLWKIGDPPGLWPLYGLPTLPADGRLYLVEGERCADTARALGLAAFTSAHGAAAAAKSDWQPVAGREIIALPDHDEPGERYVADAVRILAGLDARTVFKVARLPGLGIGGDVVDFVKARTDAGLGTDAIRAEIEALADKAERLDLSGMIGGPLLVCMADVEACAISWLWPARIPLGRLSLLVGRPGEGKSFLTTDMAARVTTGTPWPDGTDCPAGSVILICGEDDPGDTIRPRLDAHRADVRRVHLLSMVRRIDAEGKRQDVVFSLADVAALEAALKAVPDCRLVVCDPIGSFIGGRTDSNADNEVRGVLAPVAALAQKYGPAVLLVAHRRKSAGSIADDLALGSRAFTGIARAVWHLSRDTDNKARRLLLPGKCNLSAEGDGLAFTICGTPPAVSWEHDPVTMRADDALAQENGGDAKPGPEPAARNMAAEWLRQELADLAEHPVAAVKAAATAAGLASWRTVRRTAQEIGVISERATFGGGYVWRLPKPAPLLANMLANTPPTEITWPPGQQGKTASETTIHQVPRACGPSGQIQGEAAPQGDKATRIQERAAVFQAEGLDAETAQALAVAEYDRATAEPAGAPTKTGPQSLQDQSEGINPTRNTSEGPATQRHGGSDAGRVVPGNGARGCGSSCGESLSPLLREPSRGTVLTRCDKPEQP